MNHEVTDMAEQKVEPAPKISIPLIARNPSLTFLKRFDLLKNSVVVNPQCKRLAESGYILKSCNDCQNFGPGGCLDPAWQKSVGHRVKPVIDQGSFDHPPACEAAVRGRGSKASPVGEQVHGIINAKGVLKNLTFVRDAQAGCSEFVEAWRGRNPTMIGNDWW